MDSSRASGIARLWIGLLLFACTGTTAGPVRDSPSPSSNVPPPSATSSLHPTSFRTLSFVASSPSISPDGRYVTSFNGSGPTMDLLHVDGTLVARTQMGSGRAEWLPDSSGIFVETTAPQRAGPLAIIELDGTLTATELQMAQPMLSRDGRIVVAAQQEGCCVGISIREIRAGPRTGGAARSLARSTTAADVLQPIYMFGIDNADRLVYRDGPALRAVPIAGGAPTTLTVPAGLNVTALVADGVSPDGRVMVLHTVRALATGEVEVAARWVLVDGAIDPWPADGGDPLITARAAKRQQPGGILWSGDHSLLVRTADGGIAPYDFGVRKPAPFHAAVPREATTLAYANGSLLWADGPRIHVTEVETGRDRDTGLRIDGDPLAIVAAGAAGGGFLVFTPNASYAVE